MKDYIKVIGDDDYLMVDIIDRLSPEHKQYVEVLGIDRILSIGLHKTKLTNAYNLAVKFNDNNLKIKNSLAFKVGCRYTSSEITNKLQEVYNNLKIERKAVSNDIKNYYNVTKTQVVSKEDGKRKQGFIIVSDLYKEDL